MPRMERERRGFILNSGDWSAPADLDRVTGVLITRLGQGEYGLYRDGRWKRLKLADWQAQYDTIIPAGLPTGWWAIIPRLHHRLGTYQETFTKDSLDVALVCARHMTLNISKHKPMEIPGLNKGDKPTIAV